MPVHFKVIQFVRQFPRPFEPLEKTVQRAFLSDEILCIHDLQHQFSLRLFQPLKRLINGFCRPYTTVRGRKLTTLRACTIRSRSGPPKPETPQFSLRRLLAWPQKCHRRLSGLTTWRPPFRERPSFLFPAAQDLRGFFPQNSCPGSFNFSLGGKLRSNSSAASSST